MKDLRELNYILESKNEKIESLEYEIEALKKRLNLDLRFWKETQHLPLDDFRKDLPVPRLEMMHRSLDGNGCEWIYGIVRMAHPGMRKNWESKTLNFTPLSRTTTTSNKLIQGGKISTPFRDYTHIQFDGVSLNLPIFVTCPEKSIYEKIEVEDYFSKDYSSAFSD